MAEFTKIVRSLASTAGHQKPTKLRTSVGLPFWVGLVATTAVALYALPGVLPALGVFLRVAVSLLIGVIGALLIQAVADLAVAIRTGEVQKRFILTLISVIALAFIYGVIYYNAPDTGFERVFAVGSLIITSALFGYVVGRAKGK